METITPTNTEHDQYSSSSHVETSIHPGATETLDERKLQPQYAITHEQLPVESSDPKPEQHEVPSEAEESSSDQQGDGTVERSDTTWKDPRVMSGSKQDATGLHHPQTAESAFGSESLDGLPDGKGDGKLAREAGPTGPSSGKEGLGGPKGAEDEAERVEVEHDGEKAPPDVREEEVAGEEPGEGNLGLCLTWSLALQDAGYSADMGLS